MKEEMTERLSRLIDGELDPKQAEELQADLETNRTLRRELEGLSRVRGALRSLADRERPPAELDALVDPLLRGRPETPLVRPWARWLATAAAVVLGVTVVLEVQRRQAARAGFNRQERAVAGAAAEPTERFSLAPLPTSSVPADGQPRGAADRLIAAPEPEVDPTLDPAPALEVIGPLNTGSPGEEARDADPDPGVERRRVPTRDEFDEVGAVRLPRTGTSVTSSKSSRKVGAAVAGRPDSQFETRDTGDGTGEVGAAGTGAQLFVFMEAETAWREFAPDGPSGTGRYALRIRVQDGVIREVWPVGNPPAPTRQVRASQLVLGLEIENVPDGEYAAEVVVEPRRTPNR